MSIKNLGILGLVLILVGFPGPRLNAVTPLKLQGPARYPAPTPGGMNHFFALDIFMAGISFIMASWSEPLISASCITGVSFQI